MMDNEDELDYDNDYGEDDDQENWIEEGPQQDGSNLMQNGEEEEGDEETPAQVTQLDYHVSFNFYWSLTE